MIPSIIGLHYGWNILQNNENLVTADQKITEQPIIAVSFDYCQLVTCFLITYETPNRQKINF